MFCIPVLVASVAVLPPTAGPAQIIYSRFNRILILGSYCFDNFFWTNLTPSCQVTLWGIECFVSACQHTCHRFLFTPSYELLESRRPSKLYHQSSSQKAPVCFTQKLPKLLNESDKLHLLCSRCTYQQQPRQFYCRDS
jgi:hypothetical protein